MSENDLFEGMALKITKGNSNNLVTKETNVFSKFEKQNMTKKIKNEKNDLDLDKLLSMDPTLFNSNSQSFQNSNDIFKELSDVKFTNDIKKTDKQQYSFIKKSTVTKEKQPDSQESLSQKSLQLFEEKLKDEKTDIEEIKPLKNMKININTILEHIDGELVNKDKIMENYRQEISNNENCLNSIYKKIHTVKEKILKNNELIAHNQILMEEKNSMENEAIEKNDFEEAQKLENVIKEISKTLEFYKNQSIQSEKQLEKLLEQKTLLIQRNCEISETFSINLVKFDESQKRKLEEINSKYRIKLKEKIQENEKLKLEIENEKKELEIEINESKVQHDRLNKIIREQSNGLEEEIEELYTTKKGLIEQLENLNRYVRQKQREIEIVDEFIANKEKAVDEVKSTFSYEYKKIDSYIKSNEEKQKKITELEEIFNKENSLIQETQIDLSNQTENINLNQNILFSLISEFQTEVNKQKNKVKNNENLNLQIKNKNNEIEGIQTDLNLIKKSLNRLKNDLEELTINIKNSESEELSYDNKIKSLENEKKILVANKNFKEAGKISNELKDNLERKTKLNTIIQQHYGQKEELIKMIEKFETKEVSCVNKLKEAEIEKDLICYEIYMSDKTEIEEIIQKAYLNKLESDYIKIYEDELNFLLEQVKYLENKEGVKLRLKEKVEKVTIEEEVTLENSIKSQQSEVIKTEEIIEKPTFIINFKKIKEEDLLNEDEIEQLKLEIFQ